MFDYEIKIPKDRIPVLIGKKGNVKRKIEKATGTKLIIDSEEGNVVIKSEDSFAAFNTRSIVQAIGRGFNPSVALQLTNETYTLQLVEITEFTGKSKKKMYRLKSRVIGTKGKAWKTVERLTGCKLSVYGKTIGIIGPVEEVELARQAIEDLLKGAPHSHIYQYLQDKKKLMRKGLR